MGQQSYKIFINKHTLIFTNNKQIANTSKGKRHKPSKLIALAESVCAGEYSGEQELVFICDKPSSCLKTMKKHFKVIKAAGGVVFNEDGHLLLIKRLGIWDLPKGKIEEGEEERIAAIREVHEECGINFLGLYKKLSPTYHMYPLKGEWILKKTEWFKMMAWNSSDLVPQTEEDITEVRWVNENFIRRKTFKTYESLSELMQGIEFPKK
jgi:ADP-ribose pyrophosphatase YjhB (NUDIX family)